MHPKDAEGIANSVDPDQAAPSLIWVCTVCPDLSVRKLRNITVEFDKFFIWYVFWLKIWNAGNIKVKVKNEKT